MSVSTLTRFTVPLASDQSASTQGLLMPKLKYRFRVSLNNFGVTTPTTELTKQVVDVTRPNIQFETMTLDVYNSKVFLAGKHTWQTITLNLRDEVTGTVQKLVGEQLQKQFDFFEQASAASGQDYKFTMSIEILDGGNGTSAPNVLETWECYGCFLTQADYGNLAYSANEQVQIALTIQPDNCIQGKASVQTPSGVGIAVGRGLGTAVTGGGT